MPKQVVPDVKAVAAAAEAALPAEAVSEVAVAEEAADFLLLH